MNSDILYFKDVMRRLCKEKLSLFCLIMVNWPEFSLVMNLLMKAPYHRAGVCQTDFLL